MKLLLYKDQLNDLPIEIQFRIQELRFRDNQETLASKLKFWQHDRGYFYGMIYTDAILLWDELQSLMWEETPYRLRPIPEHIRHRTRYWSDTFHYLFEGSQISFDNI